MRKPLISTFSKPTEPINQWVTLLRVLGINSVFLNTQDCHPHLLSLLAKNKIKAFLEFGLFSNDPLLWKKFPEARVVGRNGKVLKNLTFDRKPICPSNPKVRKVKLENLNKISKKFSFACIFLDGLRFPSAWEKKVPESIPTCFCPNCQELFAHHQGIKPPQDAKPDWPLRLYPKNWYQWRTNQLVEFLKEAKTIMRRNNSKTKLGIFVVPLTKKEFANSIIKVFAQDILAFSKSADFISPMLYHRMCARQPSWIKKRIKYFSRLTQKPILPTVQTRDMPESLPNRITISELKKIINFILSSPSKGVILFTLDNALAVFPSDKIRQILKDVRIK